MIIKGEVHTAVPDMKGLYAINIQLFADGGGDKTEKATPKKRQEARKRGQVLQSREIVAAMVLVFVFVALRVFGKYIFEELKLYAVKAFTEYPENEGLYTFNGLTVLFADTVMVLMKVVGPIFAVAIISGLIAGYAQVGFLFTLEPLTFKFERINPFSGMKRIFSLHGAVELVKALLKIVIIGYIAYSYLNGEKNNVMQLMDMNVSGIGTYIGMTSVNVAIRICVALVVLALFDYGYQWWEYEKNLKMTKQEMKEEYKQTEGNPEIKSRIKQKQRQLSMRRMLHEVPKADVVITNPTHYAVAIRYDAQVSDAPVVVAKGQDFLALRIKDIARENDVQVVENRPLAKTLYESVDVGESIPPEMYQAVAEILAFVYNLKNKTVEGRSGAR